MNYDPKKLPERPQHVPYECKDLVYIGKGTDPSIAYTYNDKEPFIATRIENGQTYGNASCWGDLPYMSYYVSVNSPLLPKMFPVDQTTNDTNDTNDITEITKRIENLINAKSTNKYELMMKIYKYIAKIAINHDVDLYHIALEFHNKHNDNNPEELCL